MSRLPHSTTEPFKNFSHNIVMRQTFPAEQQKPEHCPFSGTGPKISQASGTLFLTSSSPTHSDNMGVRLGLAVESG